MRSRERFTICRASLLGLATLPLWSCTADAPQTSAAPQSVISAPPPSNLNFVLYAATRLTIDPFVQVRGDVGGAGFDGSVLFDTGSFQEPSGNVLSNTVEVEAGASVGHVFGNDLAILGAAAQKSLGLDLAVLPAVPAVSPATPGTTNVAVTANHTRQLCPGQYGVINVGPNATLNLNGGVYHMSALVLSPGARLEPSEPVVLLVADDLSASSGSVIAPFPDVVNPMSAADIRIEVGGSAAFGSDSQVRAHLLAPGGGLTVGPFSSLVGAVWASRIEIGARSSVTGEGALAAHAPSVPPPCNDNDACTVDQCVSAGTTAFCRNTPLPPGACSRCGNGVIDPGEQCDDGNTVNGDGCSSSCTLPVCGDGIVDPGEQCDDGNTVDGDGCTTRCTLPMCGNGIVEAGEQCDDGNTVDGDGCNSFCRVPRCGDGIVDLQLGEQCDDGNTVDGDGCNNRCLLPVCGDGIVDLQLGEQCDDGNTVDGDGCNSRCLLPACGNGIVEAGEQCDDGNTVDGDGCNSRCLLPACGNGIVEAGEQCDDGNTVDGDGCSSRCSFAQCGNLILEPGEEADPAVSPSQIVPVDGQTCRFDFSAITQLYCNGSCGVWGDGVGDCQQSDADAFCKLRTGNPNSAALSFAVELAHAAPGICCPNISGLGCTDLGVLDDRGVQELVSVHETNLFSTHGAGFVVTNVVCTP